MAMPRTIQSVPCCGGNGQSRSPNERREFHQKVTDQPLQYNGLASRISYLRGVIVFCCGLVWTVSDLQNTIFVCATRTFSGKNAQQAASSDLQDESLPHAIVGHQHVQCTPKSVHTLTDSAVSILPEQSPNLRTRCRPPLESWHD